MELFRQLGNGQTDKLTDLQSYSLSCYRDWKSEQALEHAVFWQIPNCTSKFEKNDIFGLKSTCIKSQKLPKTWFGMPS